MSLPEKEEAGGRMEGWEGGAVARMPRSSRG